MSRYIDQFRDRFGVEPICRTLAVAPSSYYAARSRPPSARATADAELKLDIARVHRDQFGVYGARKLMGTDQFDQTGPRARSAGEHCCKQDCRVPATERAPAGRRSTERLLGWRADRALVH